jgi:hypothetical protein
MMKKINTVLLLISTFGLLSMSFITIGDMNVVNHTIRITSKNDNIIVKENILIDKNKNGPYSNLTFFIPVEDDSKISVLIDNEEVSYETRLGFYYTFNLIDYNISSSEPIDVLIQYNLDKDISEFRTTIIYRTDALRVIFDDRVVFSSVNLSEGSVIEMPLFRETDSPLANYLVYILVFILFLLLILIFISLRKKKVKKSYTMSASEELLSTKKTLLMNILKEIEKQHRSKHISDDTYHKLKEQYKNEAVEAMKKLDDMKSRKK